jgi:hypothetical protein
MYEAIPGSGSRIVAARSDADSVLALLPAQPVPVDDGELADLVRELVERGRLPHDRVFALIGGLLDRVDETDLVQRRYTASALLAVTEAAVRLQDRVTGFARDLVGAADVAEAAPLAYGASLSSWLTHRFPMSTRAAHRLVREAQQAAGRPAVMVAVQQGTVRPEQGLAVCDVMRTLPDVDPVTMTEVEAVLLDWATTMTANDLRSMGGELVERLDPDHADVLLGKTVERQHRRADRDRRLVFTAHPDGSAELYACGPSAVLEPLRRQIEAGAAQAGRAALENLDDTLPRVTATQRRFDALIGLSSRVAAFEAAPVVAGDRPRVVVHVTTAQLTGLAETNRITGVTTDAGVPVPASVARRWLCDSALQPLVTDPSGRHTLGVGRAQRLATPALRTALALRDRGCVFPGCDVAAHLCDAHHVRPWWAGGSTDVDNLALLCPHHHGLLEPSRRHRDDQWTIAMSADGHPSVYAPVRIDPLQKPRRHQRHRTPRSRQGTTAP